MLVPPLDSPKGIRYISGTSINNKRRLRCGSGLNMYPQWKFSWNGKPSYLKCRGTRDEQKNAMGICFDTRNHGPHTEDSRSTG